MIDVDTEAHRLGRTHRHQARRDHAYRVAVAEQFNAREDDTSIGAFCRQHGVSASTLFYWRCEQVLRTQCESLEAQLRQAQAELQRLRQRPIRQPLRIMRTDADTRLDRLERQMARLVEGRNEHAVA